MTCSKESHLQNYHLQKMLMLLQYLVNSPTKRMFRQNLQTLRLAYEEMKLLKSFNSMLGHS